MANNVIGLFENEAVADRVVEELSAHGFNRGSIKRFQGNNAQLEDELRSEGIPADEASYYVNGLSEGGALVSVRAEESETDNAVEIMNRFVTPEETTGSEGSSSDASTQDTGWGGADSAATSGGGMAVGRAAYDSYNQQKQTGWNGASSSSSTSAPETSSVASSGPGFPIGREAYAAYQRSTPAAQGNQASSTSDAVAPAGPGFPIGREAYATYKRGKTSSWGAQSEASSEDRVGAAVETNGSSTPGFSVGREAYEAYNREKANRSGTND